MELYHIHTLKSHDNKYGEKKELNINEKSYNNRLYDRVMNMSVAADTKRYKEATSVLNDINSRVGYVQYIDKIDLLLLYEYSLKYQMDKTEFANLIEDIRETLLNAMYLKREMALDNYRKDNCPDKPSRMHSLFACTEEGLDYWKHHIIDNDIDIYRIDAMDTVFKTNEQLMPAESLSYIMAYNNSRKYFNPKSKDFDGIHDEYLVQGRVRLLEKVDERRR